MLLRLVLLADFAMQAALATMLRSQLAPTTYTGDDFGPPVFLLMSSPTEKKVSYIEVSGLRTVVNSTVRALVDSGLSSPHGLAIDSEANRLYVADLGLQKIVMYNIHPIHCGLDIPTTDLRCDGYTGYILGVKGVQVTVLQGVTSNWVAVDEKGGLFYTDQESNSVNRLGRQALVLLQSGQLPASKVTRLTQRNMQALVAADKAASLGSKEHIALLAEVASELKKSVTTLYQKDASANVGVPAGLAVKDGEILWANR